MIELLGDPRAFAGRAGGLVCEDPHNTRLATVLASVLAGHGPGTDAPPRFAIVADADGTVTGAALRTPPGPLLCTGLAADDAAPLMRRWLDHDARPPALTAPAATARSLVAAWSRREGASSELTMREALHSLVPGALRDASRPARGALGTWPAGGQALAIAWEQAALGEMGLGVGLAEVARSVGGRLREGRQFAWCVDGAPVSLVAHNPPVDRVPRIGPVYTPPEHRGRGYATHAVAALSARLLETGAREIVLFTDLANPTSNRIYAALGYRPIAEWEQHRLAI